MTYDVFLHKKAQKNLEKFSDRERIRTHLWTLEQFPDSATS
jgi:mRNA-degrading endonuclease RelE of RelBE toxin-antitoxin system